MSFNKLKFLMDLNFLVLLLLRLVLLVLFVFNSAMFLFDFRIFYFSSLDIDIWKIMPLPFLIKVY